MFLIAEDIVHEKISWLSFSLLEYVLNFEFLNEACMLKYVFDQQLLEKAYLALIDN